VGRGFQEEKSASDMEVGIIFVRRSTVMSAVNLGGGFGKNLFLHPKSG